MLKLLVPICLLLCFSAKAQDSIAVRNPSQGYAMKKASLYENVVLGVVLEDTVFTSDSIVISYHHPNGGPSGRLVKKSGFSYDQYKKRGFWNYELSMRTASENGTHKVVFVANTYEAGKLTKKVEKTVSYEAQENWSRDIELSIDKMASDEFIYDQLNVLFQLKNKGGDVFPNNTILSIDFYNGDNPKDSLFLSTTYSSGDIAPGDSAAVRLKVQSWVAFGVIEGSTYTCFSLTPRLSTGERMDDNMGNNTDCMQMYNMGMEGSGIAIPKLSPFYNEGYLEWGMPLESGAIATVFDINGAYVWHGTVAVGSEGLSINSSMSKGIYLLQLTTGSEAYTTRFMVR